MQSTNQKPYIVHQIVKNAGRFLGALHGRCFAAGWPEKEFAELLRQPGVWGLLVEEKGFILCRSAADECEILTLAVLPEHRRRGIGKALAEKAIEEARGRGAMALFLEVAASNAAARALYGGLGFTEVSVRKGYYKRVETYEDAVIMKRRLRI